MLEHFVLRTGNYHHHSNCNTKTCILLLVYISLLYYVFNIISIIILVNSFYGSVSKIEVEGNYCDGSLPAYLSSWILLVLMMVCFIVII